MGTTRSTSKTPDLENADCTHTPSVSISDISLFFSVSLHPHYSHPLSLLLTPLHSQCKVKVQDSVFDLRNIQSHFKEKNDTFESEKGFEVK